MKLASLGFFVCFFCFPCMHAVSVLLGLASYVCALIASCSETDLLCFELQQYQLSCIESACNLVPLA